MKWINSSCRTDLSRCYVLNKTFLDRLYEALDVCFIMWIVLKVLSLMLLLFSQHIYVYVEIIMVVCWSKMCHSFKRVYGADACFIWPFIDYLSHVLLLLVLVVMSSVHIYIYIYKRGPFLFCWSKMIWGINKNHFPKPHFLLSYLTLKMVRSYIARRVVFLSSPILCWYLYGQESSLKEYKQTRRQTDRQR